jgi:predicted dehydrogenase
MEKTFGVVDEFAPELDAFATAIRNGQAPEPDGVQGHRDMTIFQAIYESAKKRTAIEIQY